MGSLQEQLLKAGIVDSNKVKKVRTEKRKQIKQQPKRKASQPAVEVIKDSSNLAQYAQIQKQAKDRKLNEQRQKQQQRKELAAQIKQLIDTSKLDRKEAEIPYQFLDGKKIKKILITTQQQGQLAKRLLDIVKSGGSYELVPHEVAEKIQERDATRVLSAGSKPASAPKVDDHYSQFEVPDDLIW
ncbi:MAG: hypothetical protein ACI8P9_003007 [Parasphingorhabdus sp.]|jgi:uncharacterized protein YaiL (DUF2058 family)